jgi:hypothetical protein
MLNDVTSTVSQQPAPKKPGNLMHDGKATVRIGF